MSSSNENSTSESTMDIIKKKMMSSPLGRKKNSSPSFKTFGVPLDELNIRAGSTVPYIIRKIVEFIQNHGIGHEGIFRINGSVKVVEKMRNSFDKSGDARLEEAEDVMAVAGLLKLFLRELPESVIPENKTKTFISVLEAHMNDNAGFLKNILPLIEDIPQENQDLLQYLMRFLVQVSKQGETNKMSPMALGIVFGPNIFRCSPGLEGLKEQGMTNQIVCRFIQNHDELFKADDEPSVNNSNKVIQVQEARSPRTPPARPPPPKFQLERELTDTPPIPSPRISKLKYEAGMYTDGQDDAQSEGGSRTQTPHTPRSRSMLLSPRLGEDDVLDSRASPFMLDSECGSSVVHSPSPILSMVASELVEKTISQAVSEHLFGDSGGLWNWSSDESARMETPEKSETPTPAPRRKRKQKQKDGQKSPVLKEKNYVYDDDRPISVNERVGQLNATNNHVDSPEPWEQRPSSSPKIFDEIKSEEPVILPYKRAKGPKNRSPPSRQNLKQEIKNSTNENNLENNAEQKPMQDLSDDVESSSILQDVNHNEPKPSTGFLDIPYQPPVVSTSSPEPSPSSKKPFVPPLDLTTLHEHGDGSDPILAEQGPSITYQKSKNLQEEEEALISPRSHKLKKKTGSGDENGLDPPSVFKFTGIGLSANSNTDVAPSPPADQQAYPAYPSVGNQEEDEHTVAVRNLTKKIQTLKKKIKQFEDQFEEEKGYKPSQSDKNAKPEIKRYTTELNKVRKDLKQLKEDQQSVEHLMETYPGNQPSTANRPDSGNRPTSSKSRPSTGKSLDRPTTAKERPVSGRSASSDERGETESVKDAVSNEPPTMAVTLEQLLKKLADKRVEAGRPADLNAVTREQVTEEKLAVQKALLHFESLHGRPSTKPDKELMRPLYDRYRNVKKLLAAKPLSPKERVELEPVPENHSMNFAQKKKEEQEMGTMDFMVTRDMNLLKESPHDNTADSKHDDSDDENAEAHDKHVNSSGGAPFHALSIRELLDEQHRAKVDKKRLRKVLREFEDGFSKQHARKVQKEDRAPMAAEYEEYKQVKARLRLLEALLSKHDGSQTM